MKDLDKGRLVIAVVFLALAVLIIVPGVLS
jgi:hypothetical protein